MKFDLGEEWEAFPYLNKILMPLKEIQSLASLIHEINELEVSKLLHKMNLDIWVYFELTPSILKQLEKFFKAEKIYELVCDLEALDISHLLSPYGFCSLIGHENSKLKW